MPPRKESGKKARPSFGAARKAEPETPASWVYRSAPEPAAPVPPPVKAKTELKPAKTEPKAAKTEPKAAKTEPKPATLATAETGGQPRLDRFADWMMMPTALAIVVVFAPVSWLMEMRRR